MGTGTRETEVRLDGWCEGGLRKQRNDSGGCVTMHERSERVESPGTYVTERVFLLVTVFFQTALPYSAGYQMKRGGMWLE